MQASWFSRQGSERARNSDSAAVGQQDQHLLAVLVDGAEKGPRGAELARHWADTVLQALAETAALSRATVDSRLRQAHAQLRHGFLRDIASYCMVSLDLETLAAQIWHCGDCRVGLCHHTETRWLTTCGVPDDQIAYRSYPLLAARELLQQFIREQVHGHQAA